MKKERRLALAIFAVSFLIRFLSIWPSNTVIGFDQARDIFDARKIIADHDLRIIGPTAGNNPNLHHGVAYLYYLIPPILIGGGNPAIVALWNSAFNAGAAVVIYFLAKSLFKSARVGIIASIITGVSFYYTQFSGWLSNPTITLLTVPLFFFGCWEYYEQSKKPTRNALQSIADGWGLPAAAFFLGLSIQFELFFIYLIPIGILTWLILRPKFPNLKLLVYSISAFTLSVSTMIITEIKFHFEGVQSILSAGSFVGGGVGGGFFQRWEAFYLNFWPQNKIFGTYFGLLVLGYFVFEIIKNREVEGTAKRNLFLILWLFSPAIMLLIGIHNAPWFLIGRPAAAIIMGAYFISKIRPKFLAIPILILIAAANLLATKDAYGKGQPLLEPDPSAILAKQIAVMDYTYQKSGGQPFAIDTVTNPLYINAVWAWNYDWYGKICGYKPTWLGGDQIHPYDTLQKSNGGEKYLFLIIDQTHRIPPIYKENAANSMKKRAFFTEEKDFEGITVQMWRKR